MKSVSPATATPTADLDAPHLARDRQQRCSGGFMANQPKAPRDLLIFFQQQMDELFSLLFAGQERGGCPPECEFSPPLEIFETADQFVIEVELPGFDREDVSLRLLHRILVIEGTKRQEKLTGNARYICMERAFGRICRAVEIPNHVDVNRMRATLRDGLLAITLPKLADRQGDVRTIPID